jgi:hypothetical protein
MQNEMLRSTQRDACSEGRKNVQSSVFSVQSSTLGRSELALLYFPNLSPKSAWQKLRRWFAINPRLQPLTTMTRRTFTPAELSLIYSELGEP